MLRKNLKINIFAVQMYRITNEQVCTLFNKCDDIVTVLKARQLKYLGSREHSNSGSTHANAKKVTGLLESEPR